MLFFTLIDDPFKDDPFGKADVAGMSSMLNSYLEVINGETLAEDLNMLSASVSVKSDPFGGDPFKGSDPFAADSFFAQASSAPFSSEDPFSAPADPFGTTPGMPEPDLFAAKLNEAAPAPSAGPDPFTSKPTNPALAAKDPFMTAANNAADSDPFGGKMNAAGEADLFGSQDGTTDPFSCSPPGSDLAVVSSLVTAYLVPHLEGSIQKDGSKPIFYREQEAFTGLRISRSVGFIVE